MLQAMKLAEMQAEDCDAESIKWLDRYEKVVYRRHLESLSQAGYLTRGTGNEGSREQIDPVLV